MRAAKVNPVLARELRQRMRGPRTSIVLTLYLLLLSFAVWVVYENASRSNINFDGLDIQQVAGLGRTVFQTLLFVVLLLVCFIVPAQAAAAIAGERERQTLVPLQVTLLRSRSILLGKLLASLAFVVLLIVATVPLAGIAFLLGGVEPLEVVRATAMVLVTATLLATLALLCSTMMRRTQGATVLAYGMVLMLTLGTFVVFGAQSVFNRGVDTDNMAVLHLNPFMVVAGVLDTGADENSGSFNGPFSPFQELLRQRSQRSQAFSSRVVIAGPDAAPTEVIDDSSDRPRRWRSNVSFVMISLIAYAVLIAGALALAAWKLHVPRGAA